MNDIKLIKKTDYAAMASMFFFASSVTILPICLVKITKDLSISLTQVGILNFIHTFELLFTLIFSIYISARFGKIKVIRFAILVIASSLLLTSFCQKFWHILIVFIIRVW